MSIFNPDGKIVQMLSKLGDLITISLLWIVASIPVLTIAPATSAMYDAVDLCVNNETGTITKVFWKAFRGNLRFGMAISASLVATYLLIALDLYLVYRGQKVAVFSVGLAWCLIAVAAAIMVWGLTVCCYHAKFQDPPKRVMKNCVLICLSNLPQMLFCLVVLAVAFALVSWQPVALLIAPALAMVPISLCFDKMFRKYT